jgi:hypothetical protein
MEDDTRFIPPTRWWLLTKALENEPLDAALKIAQAVDDFLTFGELKRQSQEIPIFTDDKNNERTAGGRDTVAKSTQSDILVTSGLGHIKPADSCEEIGEPANDKEPRDENGVDMVGTYSKHLNTDRATMNGDADLAVYASIDDVVRYLRQCDDVVVPHENGQFLINDRSYEDSNELVARANRARENEGKPPFLLVPIGFAAA